MKVGDKYNMRHECMIVGMRIDGFLLNELATIVNRSKITIFKNHKELS